MNRRDREWIRETKNKKKKNIQLSFTIISYFVIYLVMPIAPKYSKKYICFTFKWCLFVNRLRNYTTRKTKDSNSQGKRENYFDETEKLRKKWGDSLSALTIDSLKMVFFTWIQRHRKRSFTFFAPNPNSSTHTVGFCSLHVKCNLFELSV